MPHILSQFARGLEANLNSATSILQPANKKAMEISPTAIVKKGANGQKKPDPDQQRIEARQRKLMS